MVRRARWRHELDALTKGFDGRVGVCAAMVLRSLRQRLPALSDAERDEAAGRGQRARSRGCW